MEIYSFVLLQGKILGSMFLLGIFMGFVYDLLRIFRRLFQVGRAFVQISDFCYWPLVILLLWHMQNETVDGVVRFCQLFFVALGMLVYYLVFSSWVIRMIYTPLHFCAKQWSRLCRYIEKRSHALFQKVAGHGKDRKRFFWESGRKQNEKKRRDESEKKVR